MQNESNFKYFLGIDVSKHKFDTIIIATMDEVKQKKKN